jgi:type IX secretion system PorP/SprF family membrane protein
VQGGFYNQAIDFGRLRPNEPGDPLIEGRGRENQFIPDFGAGIYYTKGHTFAGLSASHILEPSLNYGTIIEINSLERNYTLIGGTRFDITTDIAVSPSAIVKSNFRNTLSYEGTALVSYQDKYYGGVSFRDIGPSNDLIFLIGASFLKDNSLSLGYAFDYVLTGVAAKAATSHEIRVGYKIPAPARAQRYIIRTPRFRFE